MALQSDLAAWSPAYFYGTKVLKWGIISTLCILIIY